MDWREGEGTRWLEARLPAGRAAFSTRLGGASQGPFESLNLALHTGDDPGPVRDNRARIATALDRDAAGMLIGRQVHGATVVRRERAPHPNPYAEAGATPASADGQSTASPALTPIVQVADCLPVALAGSDGVAMIHCGWRGLASGVVEAGARAVGATAAAIGPAIGPCCYRVGAEVLAEFESLGDGVAEGSRLDLTEVARRLLARAGVAAVESAGLCTSCERELFFSHRRDGGRTGRQAGLVWSEAGG